jgi:tetratricopeptide (TPR) repeat protein
MDKINRIKQILSAHSVAYINIPEQRIDIIYDLFVNNIECDIESFDDDIVYLYFGVYYLDIKNNNHDIALKCYLKSIEKGNICAMNNLAFYYQRKKINYKLAEKYFLMAINIDKENDKIMYHLAYYYYHYEKNYKLAKKYLLMAVDRGNYDAMIGLAYYYINYKKNNVMAKHYFFKTKNACVNNYSNPYTYVKFINELLSEEFDIGIAIERYNFIDGGNTEEFHKKIRDVLL